METITQSFSLLALNAQSSDRMTVAKRVALRAAAAAAILELVIERGLSLDEPCSLSPDDSTLARYQQIVLSELLCKRANEPLFKVIESVTELRNGGLKKIERAIVDSLLGDHLIEDIPSLISCDMYIHEAGVEYREYRAEQHAYLSRAEGLRAEVLEYGELTDECVAMLWLLRESGALVDFFSEDELTAVGQRTLSAYRENPLAKSLYLLMIHKKAERSLKGMLHAKTKLLATDAGLGVNFLMPVLERSKVIFIEVDAIGAKAANRMESIRERLSLLGHRWEFVHQGRVPLVRIDNVVYECVPDGVTVGAVGIRVPVYGVRLRRYPVFL